MQGIYEQRLCAFVDILGFGDLVRKSLDRPALQGKIRQVLREVILARPVWERDSPVDVIEARLRQEDVLDPQAEAERLVNEYAAAERGYSFSDCLVLSSALNDRAITGLVTSLLFLSGNLAELGVYARGGVYLGQLCHEQDLCFGPALIEAYNLEKKFAKYPRIIFSTEAYGEVAQVNMTSLGPLASYLREDVVDGWRFLDFLNQTAPHLALPTDQMRVIRRELNRYLSCSNVKPQVREKHVWLGRYFNLALEEGSIVGIDPLSVGA